MLKFTCRIRRGSWCRRWWRYTKLSTGIFATPMMKGLPQEVQDSLAAEVTFPKRLGDPAEYAALAGFIVGCGYLNGEVIRLDGALRMR